MKMPHRILVVISGKRKEHEALQRALTFAQYSDIHIHLLNVIYEPVLELTDVLSSDHRKEMKRQYLADRYLYLDSLADELDKKGINCSVRVEWSREIHETIVEVADQLEPDLVIKRISADPLSINPFALPLDRYLLRFCNAPLLLVKQSNWSELPILATVDVLATDEQHITLNKEVLESAKLVAYITASQLHTVSAYIVHSVSSAIDFSTVDLDSINASSAQYHQQKLDELAHQQLIDVSKSHVIGGLPEQVIPSVAKQIGAQLVVIGTVARKGISAALMANTVESVLAELNCEVLALKCKTPVLVEQL